MKHNMKAQLEYFQLVKDQTLYLN